MKASSRKRKTIGQRSRAQVEENRDGIYMRDDHRCVVAGSRWAARYPCRGALTVQHAVGRGMGGSAQFDSPAFLRTMCWDHNLLETSDAAFARACDLLGWSIPRGAVRLGTELVAVRYPDGLDYVLTDDFQKTLLPGTLAAEFRGMLYPTHEEAELWPAK